VVAAAVPLNIPTFFAAALARALRARSRFRMRSMTVSLFC